MNVLPLSTKEKIFLKLADAKFFICLMHQEVSGRCHEGNRAEAFHIHHRSREAQVPQAPIWAGLGA